MNQPYIMIQTEDNTDPMLDDPVYRLRASSTDDQVWADPSNTASLGLSSDQRSNSTLTDSKRIARTMYRLSSPHDPVLSYIRTDVPGMPLYIESPWDVARRRSIKMRLYDKRVPFQWYNRYMDTLPRDEAFRVQPLKEINERDHDMALGRFLGFDHPCLIDARMRKSADCDVVRWHVYHKQQRENELKEKELRRLQREEEKKKPRSLSRRGKFLAAKTSGTLVWFTKKDQETASKTIAALVDYAYKKMYIRVKDKAVLYPDSKWRTLKKKFRKAVAIQKCEAAARRFAAAIKSVYWVHSFCMGMLKRVREPFVLYAQFEKAASKVSTKSDTAFNPNVYSFHKTLNPDVIDKLRTPWRTRSDRTVHEIMEGLLDVNSFSAMPDLFQMYLAKVAWYMTIPDKTVILREGQRSENFYFILSGSVRATKFRGSTIAGQRSEAHLLRTFTRHEIFGLESLMGLGTLRQYTARAVSQCNLLAVPVRDYHEVTLDTDWNNVEPEHITFTKLLLESMDLDLARGLIYTAGNIIFHYFVAGATITGSAKESEFVFMVSSGKVLALSMVRPSVIHHVFDVKDRRKGSLHTYMPGVFEMELSRALDLPPIATGHAKNLMKKYTGAVPTSFSFKSKGTMVDQQTKYYIYKTKNLWVTLSRQEQNRILINENPGKLRQHMEFLLQPGSMVGQQKKLSIAPTAKDFLDHPTAQFTKLTSKLDKRRTKHGSRRLSSLESVVNSAEPTPPSRSSRVWTDPAQGGRSSDNSSRFSSNLRHSESRKSQHEVGHSRAPPPMTSGVNTSQSLGAMRDKTLVELNENNSAIRQESRGAGLLRSGERGGVAVMRVKSSEARHSPRRVRSKSAGSHKPPPPAAAAPPTRNSSSATGRQKQATDKLDPQHSLDLSNRPRSRTYKAQRSLQRGESQARASEARFLTVKGSQHSDRCRSPLHARSHLGLQKVASSQVSKQPSAAVTTPVRRLSESSQRRAVRMEDAEGLDRASPSSMSSWSSSSSSTEMILDESSKSEADLGKAASTATDLQWSGSVSEASRRRSSHMAGAAGPGSLDSLSRGLHEALPQKSKHRVLAEYVEGDVIGVEWIDFKNGKYRKPANDFCLVSQGAAVIMVRKSMLSLI